MSALSVLPRARYFMSTWFRFSSPDGRFVPRWPMYPMSSRNWPGSSRCRLNVQLLMYPGLPAPGFIYSIVPPFASVGSILGRLAVNAGREGLVKGRRKERSRLQEFERAKSPAGAGIRQAQVQTGLPAVDFTHY